MSDQRSVTVAGVRSPVLTAGRDDADEAVVFVHGNPGAGREWADLLQRVGDFTRAIAPDMPGFADADKPRDSPYNVDGYARHLDGILGELGIRRVPAARAGRAPATALPVHAHRVRRGQLPLGLPRGPRARRLARRALPAQPVV